MSIVIALIATAASLPIMAVGMILVVMRILTLASAVEAAVRETSQAKDTTREAEKQRDEAVVARAQSDDARQELSAELMSTQAALTNARSELTKNVEKQLAGATDADVARIVDGLLASPLPGSAHSSASGNGATATDSTLSVASVARPDRPGR